MPSSQYGHKLNDHRHLRDLLGVKGERQSIVVMNNTLTSNKNQQLLVRLPNLSPEDVIVPGSARLAFTIELTSADVNQTLVNNIGHAIVKKKTIRFLGNKVMSIDDCDVFHCYHDVWRTAQEKANAHYQGLNTLAGRNITKLWLGAGDAIQGGTDGAIAPIYGNRFYIPLDFEMLMSLSPFLQKALTNRLQYELTFNDHSRMILATGDPNASYRI